MGHYRALIRKETFKIYSSIKSIYAYCIVRFSDLHGPLISGMVLFMPYEGLNTGL